MSLQERLTADMKAAMKAGERDRLEVIRMLIADLKQEQLKRQVATTSPRPTSSPYCSKAVKVRREAVAQAEEARPRGHRQPRSAPRSRSSTSYLPADDDRRTS